MRARIVVKPKATTPPAVPAPLEGFLESYRENGRIAENSKSNRYC
jgi:hypothetical protein